MCLIVYIIAVNVNSRQHYTAILEFGVGQGFGHVTNRGWVASGQRSKAWRERKRNAEKDTKRQLCAPDRAIEEKQASHCLAMRPGSKVSKFVVMVDWNEVPHLSAEQKKEMWASIPAYQRDARAKGIPMLGSGAIYPLLESEVICEPFSIPKYWPRVYGLDIGWNRTAAVWAAKDDEGDKLYLYAEHYGAAAEPAVHAAAIRAKGTWIPGVIDPASRQRSTNDGSRMIEQYLNYDLSLFPADNSIDAGISSVWDMLSGGRLKVFSTLHNWRNEFRIYRRDEKGKIVKKDDHLMDATRYLVMSGLAYASVEPGVTNYTEYFANSTRSSSTGY